MSEENLYTFENPEYRRTYWHTCSHVLAQAMKRLHPEVKLAIGPSIETGFYYDFDVEKPFTEEDLAALEAEMRKICKEKLKLERFELPRAEAIRFMEEKEEPYKVELIQDLPEDRASLPTCAPAPIWIPPAASRATPSSSPPPPALIGAAIPSARCSSGSTAWPSPRRRSWTNIWPGRRRP